MPGTRRIFAGVSGSPGSVDALRQAAQLAHHPAAQAAQRVSARTADWPSQQGGKWS
jgi:hypothetical protein